MKKTKHLFLLLLLVLWNIGQLTAQTLTAIKGTITDGKEPLVGATVLEKGTSNGTLTDIDGKFELTLKGGKSATLAVSFVGYTPKELAVKSGQTIDIQLESSSDLDEVVVVGYGTQRKAVVTGAIAKVKGSDLENMPVPRIEQSLLGRTAGVRVTTGSGQPGEGATVRIRGTTSINASEPLYVVDGIP